MLPYSSNRVCNNFCCRYTKPMIVGVLAEARAALEAHHTPLFETPEFYDLIKRIDKVLEMEESLVLVPA